MVGGTKSSDLCRASLPTSARAHILEALSDLLARSAPPPPEPPAPSDGEASSDASAASGGAAGSDAAAATDAPASSDADSRSDAAPGAGSDAGPASGPGAASNAVDASGVDGPSASDPAFEAGADPASDAVDAVDADAAPDASAGSDTANPSSEEPTTSSSASDDDCVMADPDEQEPLQDGLGSHLRREPTESLEDFRARNADERRRNVLRRTFALVAKHQRTELRAALEKRLEAAKAVAAGHIPAAAHDVFIDAAFNDDTGSESDCIDASCSQLDGEAAAGRVANGVLWGRARGKLPLDEVVVEIAGEEGDSVPMFAGESQRMQRHVQLSDLENVADATWWLSAGKHTKLAGVCFATCAPSLRQLTYLLCQTQTLF